MQTLYLVDFYKGKIIFILLLIIVMKNPIIMKDPLSLRYYQVMKSYNKFFFKGKIVQGLIFFIFYFLKTKIVFFLF